MGENVANIGRRKMQRRFRWEKLQVGDHLGNRRVVLILILKESNEKSWIDIMWFKIETVA